MPRVDVIGAVRQQRRRRDVARAFLRAHIVYREVPVPLGKPEGASDRIRCDERLGRQVQPSASLIGG
jgi:hypothetical protein